MPHSHEESINERFRELMFSIDKKGPDLARELDVTTSTITRTTKGDTLPSSKLLIPLGQKLGVSIDWLLFGEGDMLRDPSKSGNFKQVTGNANSDSGDSELIKFLKKEIEMLKKESKLYQKTIQDKDKTIADKDEIIQLLRDKNS